MMCFPKATLFINSLNIVKVNLKFRQKPLRNKFEGFYTLFSCQDNTDCLEYLFMFKLIVPVLSNIPSLKAADKNSYHTFPFFYYGYLVQVKKVPAKYRHSCLWFMFQFSRNLLAKFCFKIKQPAPLSPDFVKVNEIIQKRSDFP